MPTQPDNSLAQLAQLAQLFGGNDQQAALQQHAQMQWLQMQQAQQQHAADLALHRQQLAQTGAYQQGELAQRAAAMRAAEMERKANTVGRVLEHHLSMGGKLTDFVGQGLMKSIDPETAQLLSQGVAQSTAQKHLGVLQQYMMANALDPKDVKTQALIRQHMDMMGGLDPSVQQYIPWQSLNEQFKAPGIYSTGSASAGVDPEKLRQMQAYIQQKQQQDEAEKKASAERLNQYKVDDILRAQQYHGLQSGELF